MGSRGTTLRIIRYLRDGTPVYDLGATLVRKGGTKPLRYDDPWLDE